MSLFGAIVRTVVNVVTLPVKLPIAVLKDAVDFMDGEVNLTNVSDVIEEIKDDAEASK